MTNNLNEQYKPMFDFNVNQREYEETNKVLEYLNSPEIPDGIRFTEEFDELINIIHSRLHLCRTENEKLVKLINR